MNSNLKKAFNVASCLGLFMLPAACGFSNEVDHVLGKEKDSAGGDSGGGASGGGASGGGVAQAANATAAPKSTEGADFSASDEKYTYLNKFGMEFALLPPKDVLLQPTSVDGPPPMKFDMGCYGGGSVYGHDGASGLLCEPNEGSDKGLIKHEVTLSKAFYMQMTEVTQGQWNAIMGSNPSEFSTCGDVDNCPVENVSYLDVEKFLTTLNGLGQGSYRLPTEAEWEYAARAGEDTAYSFGASPSTLGDYGWYVENSDKKTHPVKLKGKNPWGLYDMHGNVCEWTKDVYSSEYSSADPQVDPKSEGASGPYAARGGSWFHSAEYLRSARRFTFEAVDTYPYLGFRVIVVPPGHDPTIKKTVATQ